MQEVETPLRKRPNRRHVRGKEKRLRLRQATKPPAA